MADLLRSSADRGPDELARVRWPYEVGLLARGQFRDVTAYGRSLGVRITLYPSGGLLVQRGHAVAEGRWGDVRRFLVELDRLLHVAEEEA